MTKVMTDSGWVCVVNLYNILTNQLQDEIIGTV